MFKTKSKSKDSEAVARVKKRFAGYKRLAFVLGLIGIWFLLYIFYSISTGVSRCQVGMVTCVVNQADLTRDFYIFAWIVLEALIVLTFYVATRANQLITHLGDLEKEHLQLVGMQQAYMRNAAIAEHPDALNGTYHNKIYKAAVRDIENIINK